MALFISVSNQPELISRANLTILSCQPFRQLDEDSQTICASEILQGSFRSAKGLFDHISRNMTNPQPGEHTFKWRTDNLRMMGNPLVAKGTNAKHEEDEDETGDADNDALCGEGLGGDYSEPPAPEECLPEKGKRPSIKTSQASGKQSKVHTKGSPGKKAFKQKRPAAPRKSWISTAPSACDTQEEADEVAAIEAEEARIELGCGTKSGQLSIGEVSLNSGVTVHLISTSVHLTDISSLTVSTGIILL